MTQEKQLYNSVATLGNVVSLVELVLRLQHRTTGLPGMATFFGPSGYGKTTAVIYAANKFGAAWVQVKSQWTRRYFVEMLMAELGLDRRRSMTIPSMVDAVGEEMGKRGIPLLIDEADILADRGMIEITRDIYESSGVPVILIGEETLPKKLERWERIHGRMLDWVGAQPGTLDDVRQLAAIYCPRIEVSVEFQETLLRESRHSIRRICNNLDRVREFASTRGMTSIGLRDWGGQSFCAAAAPAARRLAA